MNERVKGVCFFLLFAFLNFKKCFRFVSSSQQYLCWLHLLLMIYSAEQQGPQSVAFWQETMITASVMVRDTPHPEFARYL